VDNFEPGEGVWVSLEPAPGGSFAVRRVSPHLAHFVPPPGLDGSAGPPLDEPIAARVESVLASVVSPFHAHATSHADALVLRGWELTPNAYVLAYCDVSLEGELRLVQPRWTGGHAVGAFVVARLCSPVERAFVATRTPLAREDLAVALVRRHNPDDLLAQASTLISGVALVVCSDVAWTPEPASDHLRPLHEAASAAFHQRAFADLRIEDHDGDVGLIVTDGDGEERSLCRIHLSPIAARGAALWADAVSAALTGERED
jgi:hypothetical protein